MGSLSAQALLTLGAVVAVVFVLGVLVGIFFRPDQPRAHRIHLQQSSGATREQAMQVGADAARHLQAVGARRLRAGPLRESLDDACQPHSPGSRVQH